MSDKHHPPQPEFIADQDAQDSGAEDDDDSDKPKDKKTGRRKIKIEFIQDKSRRHITFSKRKAGASLSLPFLGDASDGELTFARRHHEESTRLDAFMALRLAFAD